MAVRQPLYWDTGSGSIKTMTSGEVDSIVSQVSYLYSISPSVILTVEPGGEFQLSGNIANIPDTRKSAGAYRTFTTRFPTEAETAEPGTVTVNYNRLRQTVSLPSQPNPGIEGSYPVYYYNGGIRAMNDTDVYDTFISPAIDNLTSGSTGIAQAGTYRIHTSTSLAGHTLISSLPVFTDTRANTALYTAGGIPEALDQPTTITNFYLFRINGSPNSYIQPLRVTATNNNLQTFSTSLFDTLLRNHVNYAAAAGSGLNIRYNYSTGNNRGSGMTNTILNGSGNYQTRYVNTDDYRAQEFPNGTAVTAATTYLKINKS